MKTSFIIAATLFAGSVSAQQDIKTSQSSSTGVSVQATPKSASISTDHNQATSVRMGDKVNADGQSAIKTDINTAKASKNIRAGANQAADATTDVARGTANRSRKVATSATNTTVKTGARVKSNTSAAAENVSQSARVQTGNGIKTTRVAVKNASNASPKAHVKVISNSAISIKR